MTYTELLPMSAVMGSEDDGALIAELAARLRYFQTTHQESSENK